MPLLVPPVYVFVSSTFRDTIAERDSLARLVFPELRERLSWLGLELRDVDLRWGVPVATAEGEPANSWTYCKRWIERTDPFFIAILGQRYGSPPEGGLGPGDEVLGGMSITEMEIQHAVLLHRLRRRAFFYFRGTPVPPDVDQALYRQYVDVERQLSLETLKQKIREQSGRPVRDYQCTWSGTGFSDLNRFCQMVLDDLWSGVLRDQRFVPRWVWRTATGDSTDTESVIADEANPIPECIWSLLVEAWQSDSGALHERRTAQVLAATGRVQGREQELSELLRFALDESSGSSPRILFVMGEEGIGKTTLLAAFVQALSERGYEIVGPGVPGTSGPQRGNAPGLVLANFISDPAETNAEGLAATLLDQWSSRGPTLGAHTIDPADHPPLTRLVRTLTRYRSGPRLIAVVDDGDGLDRRWIPPNVGEQARLVASASKDLEWWFWGDPVQERRLGLEKLRPEAISDVIQAYFTDYCKELDPADVETIAQLPAAGHPLYLLVVLNELRRLGGADLYVRMPRIISDLFQRYRTSEELFSWVLAQTTEQFGDVARDWCSYLVLSFDGLPPRDLASLVASRNQRADADVYIRLERWMKPYLVSRGQDIQFSHRTFWLAARQLLPFDYGPHYADLARCFPDSRSYAELAGEWTRLVKLVRDHDLAVPLEALGATETYPHAEPGSWFQIDYSCRTVTEFSCLRCGYYWDSHDHPPGKQCPKCRFAENEETAEAWRQVRQIGSLRERSGRYVYEGVPSVGAKNAAPHVEDERAAIEARNRRGERVSDTGGSWYRPYVNIHEIGGYNVYCKYCGAQDDDYGRPPFRCPHCGAK